MQNGQLKKQQSAVATADDMGKKMVPLLRRLARRDARATLRRADPRMAGAWHIVGLDDRSGDAVAGRVAASSPDGPNAPFACAGSGTDTATGKGTGAHDAAMRRETVVTSPAAQGASASERKTPPRAAAHRAEGAFAPELVDTALSAGLVERDGDTVRLSSGGAAYLRRLQTVSGQPFAAQHRAEAVRTVDSLPTAVNINESPLGWLRSRIDRRTGQPMLTESQFEAGERLRADFHRAQLTARVTADWSQAMSGGRTLRSDGAGRADLSDSAIAAKERFYRALEETGDELGDVLYRVCCEGRGLRDVEQAKGWPQRAGKVMVQTALQSLARHYGLEPSRIREQRGPIQHWGDANYRPSVDGKQ